MVATVVELASSAAALSYYEREGYYAKNDPEHRQASFWHGAAAGALGLRGHVHPRRFEELLSGEVPDKGIRLGRMREGEREHRPGWDLTFSAPKSVSLEALVVGDRRVIRAHDEAVRATLDWIEAELLETRGWDPATGRRPRVKADGMAVAGFRHLTSRKQDPQLHTHCVLANMTRTESGAWRSVEPTRIRRSAKLAGAFYRNELARRLQALGMATVPTMVGRIPGFELAGYDRSFLVAFSGRRREILAYLEQRGLPYTPAVAQMAALHTRRRKRDVGLAELVPKWRERARAFGLERDRMALAPPRPVDPETGARPEIPPLPPPDLPANVIRNRKRAPALPHLPRGDRAPRKGRRAGRPSAPPVLSKEPELGPLEAVARAVAHAGERQAVIPEAEIRATALGHAPGRWTLADIDAAIARLVREGELVETPRRGADRAFVTDRAVKAERRLLELARAGRGRAAAIAIPAEVDARLEGGRLTDGQREAVRTLLLATDAVVGVQGHAGSGKTTMLREVAALAGDRRVLGLAPSAAAARVLAREAGIETETLQRFLVRHADLSDPVRLERARSELGCALIAVDEASMVDTVRMEALLTVAKTLGTARVALVGDTRQLRAVDAGQPFRLLQKAGMETAVMDEVLRQRDPGLRQAVRQSREGAPGAAIEGLGERVREAARGELGAEAGRRWLAMDPGDRAETAIMAPTHAIRRETNDAVRAGLEDEGALHGASLRIDRLVDRRLTRAQAADVRSWEPGDTVVFHRDAYGCLEDDVCTVTAIEDGMVVLDAPGGERRFRPSGNSARWCRLHDTEEIEIRTGDRIRWTRNRMSRPGRRRRTELVNGGEAEVVAIEGRLVRFRHPDGRAFTLARNDVQLRHLDHAYCTTVHAAQGRTARSAIAVLESAGAADQALFHVELSRASENFLLITDDRDGLVEALEGRPGSDDGALEALGIDPARPPVVDPEIFAELASDWRKLQRRGEETGREPHALPGCAEIMARAAALSAIEDLPLDMRRMADTMLEGHERRIAEEREARDLAARVRAHWRRWPEIGWAAKAKGCLPEEMPGHAAWRREGDALLEAARARPGEAGLREGIAAIERARLLDDSGRFRRGWRALRDSALRDSVPELHCAGSDEIARLGERLDGAEGLDEGAARAVAEWKEIHAGQAARAGAVRELSARADRWRERKAEFPPGPHDPADPARRESRENGERIVAEAGAMLADGSPHAPHLDAMPGDAETVRRSLPATAAALTEDRGHAFAWLAKEVDREAKEGKVPAFHVPRCGELANLAGELAWDPAVPDADAKVARAWLDRHAAEAALVREIRDWPRQADDLMKRCPGPDAKPEALADWRKRTDRAMAERWQMLHGKGPHAAHAAAMPEEIERLRAAWEPMHDLVQASIRDELRMREAEAERQAESVGGIAFDAPAWGVLMERVREFGTRGDLSIAVGREFARLKGRDARWTKDRAAVARVMDAADATLGAHEELEGAAGRDRAGAWLDEADRVMKLERALPKDMTDRERAAHLAAAGRKPEALGEAMDGIRSRVAREVAERERMRLADDVLVLSCAVSERVDAASPVHRDTLPGDIRAVLESSAAAGNVPETEVREIAAGIARSRAETDLRVVATREVDDGGHFEARARYGGGPKFSMMRKRKEYEAAVRRLTPLLDGEDSLPKDRETRVARVVVATRGTERHELALAMAEALKLGTTATADEIRDERAALVAELQREGPEDEDRIGQSLREKRLLRRVCASFTGAEVRAMCEGGGPVLERLPGGAREKVRETVLGLHRRTVPGDPSPWRRRQEAVAREFGLVRDRGAERDRGHYPEIEPW